nr:cytochrome b/b6 domain-containing protein [Zobellella endophytica]
MAGSDGAHLLAANVLVAIVGLHVVAALYHRLVAKDGVWERMFGRDIGTEIQP